MKISNLFLKIGSAGVLMIILLLVTISCKKKDDTPTPEPNPPAPVEQKDVFQDKPLVLVTDYEQNHHSVYSASLFHKHMSQIKNQNSKGGILSGIFSAISAVHKYYEHKKEVAFFQNMNKELIGINSQLQVIQAELNELAQEIHMSTNLIINQMQTIDQNQWAGYMQTSFGDTCSVGTSPNYWAPGKSLRWYTFLAAQYQAGIIDSVQLYNYIHTDSVLYVSQFTNTPGILDYINDLVSTLEGSSTAGTAGSFRTTATALIGFCSAGKSDSASIKIVYEMFENYFEYYMTCFLQGTAAQLNYYNYIDPTGEQARDYFIHNTPHDVNLLVNTWLECVDYLLTNITDYRTATQWNSDSYYFSPALAYDNLTIRAMARARFLANVYLDAVGLPYPSFCGSIVIPDKYSTAAPRTMPVTMNTTTLTPITDTLINSQVPYTWWQGTSLVYWDNSWRVIKYGIPNSQQHPFAGGTAQPLSLTPSWPGKGALIKGNVTPMWYNPQDPSQTSKDSTATCTMEFSYFGAAWRWGVCELYWTARSSATDMSAEIGEVLHIGGGGSAQFRKGRSVSQYHSVEGETDDFTNSYIGSFNQTFGACSGGFSNYMVAQNNTWIILDYFEFPVTAQAAPSLGGSLSGFCSAGLTWNGSGGWNMGLVVGYQSRLTNPEIIPSYAAYWPDNPAVNLSQPGWTSNIVTPNIPSTSNPCVVWYASYHQNKSTIQCDIGTDVHMQYVYQGFTTVPE